MLTKEQRKEQDRKIRKALGLSQSTINEFRFKKVFKDGAAGVIDREEAIDMLLDLGLYKSRAKVALEKFVEHDDPIYFRKLCKALFDAYTWDDPEGLTYDVDEMLALSEVSKAVQDRLDEMMSSEVEEEAERTKEILSKINDKTVTADDLHEVVGLLEKHGITLGQALKLFDSNKGA